MHAKSLTPYRPSSAQLAELLERDLAGLDRTGGRPFRRRLHAAEVAILAAAVGHRVPDRDRRRWSVNVCPDGPRSVLRIIRDANGHQVAELVDEPAERAS